MPRLWPTPFLPRELTRQSWGKAIETCESDAPRVLITRINRRKEDLGGLRLARRMRRKRPQLGVIYMAAVWPAYLHRCALEFRERFLLKPVALNQLIRTVRELLAV